MKRQLFQFAALMSLAAIALQAELVTQSSQATASPGLEMQASFALKGNYSIDTSWPTGYQVTVTLVNSSTSSTNSWTASFQLPKDQSISSLWNGGYTTSGQVVTVTNPTWIGGGVISAGGSTTFGMIVGNPKSGSMGLANLAAAANGSTPVPTPIPTAPVLDAITVNPSTPNNYTVSWNSVNNATSYTLQQDTTSNFSNPQVMVQGAQLSRAFTNQAQGTYYYRLSASNTSGISPFSNVQKVVISSQPQPQPQNATVESYWESWNSKDPISAIVQMKVDVINVSFVNFQTTGTHTFTVGGLDCDIATLQQFIAAAHSAGKKVKVAVGGATYPLAPQLKTTQDAIGMAQAVAQFVNTYKFDGVDYDIEDYPAVDLQIALLQNTRQLLGTNALISYTPKAPASTTAPYIGVIQAGYQYVDKINIMAYDAYPGYSYQHDVMDLIQKGIPAAKIVVGLMPGYDDVGELTSLDEIKEAAQFIMSNNLGGIMFWDLNRDYENQTGLGMDAATNAAWSIIH